LIKENLERSLEKLSKLDRFGEEGKEFFKGLCYLFAFRDK